ncbi:MAG: acetyl-CoA carboxylase carboxyltransferase subunit alpha [Bacteriovoracaceae bacterium]
MEHKLEFEKSLTDLENKIKELRDSAKPTEYSDALRNEINALEREYINSLKEIYKNLSPWDRVQLSRHPDRPHTLDFVQTMVRDFHELFGDQRYADDKAMLAGFGFIGEQRICLIGIEKGRKTKDKIFRNFGMVRPEGYRKALRVMRLAEQFKIPIVILIDTPGAYPGVGAEERGQSQAIAENLLEMFNIKVPIISIVIGEGGSGGALALGIADAVMMMEFAVYSVISPESCASILWSDPRKAEMAANSLKLDPQNTLKLGIIDEIISEPTGGAHREPKVAIEMVEKRVVEMLNSLSRVTIPELLDKRFKKFRQMGNQTLENI